MAIWAWVYATQNSVFLHRIGKKRPKVAERVVRNPTSVHPRGQPIGSWRPGSSRLEALTGESWDSNWAGRQLPRLGRPPRRSLPPPAPATGRRLPGGARVAGGARTAATNPYAPTLRRFVASGCRRRAAEDHGRTAPGRCTRTSLQPEATQRSVRQDASTGLGRIGQPPFSSAPRPGTFERLSRRQRDATGGPSRARRRADGVSDCQESRWVISTGRRHSRAPWRIGNTPVAGRCVWATCTGHSPAPVDDCDSFDRLRPVTTGLLESRS